MGPAIRRSASGIVMGPQPPGHETPRAHGTPVWQRAVAGLGLAASLPLLGAAAIMIKKSDPGPVLYRATRAGAGGKHFVMYKLRTMRQHTDALGSITAAGDARVFPAGQLLRRVKLDELPQLANVLRGQMALVGPRPEAFEIVQNHYLPWMMETLTVPPGITGPGSLHYIEQEKGLPTDPSEALRVYLDTLLPRKLAFELVYVRARSTRYELQLIGRTLLGVLGLRRNDTPAGRRETIAALRILDEVSGRRVS